MKYLLPFVLLLSIACSSTKNVELTEKNDAKIVENTAAKANEKIESTITKVKQEAELPIADNEELQQIYKEDQADRQASNIDWSVVGPRDEARQARVNEMIEANLIKTGRDHYNAAMVFQHGGDTIASGKAVAMMKKAVALDTTVNNWLLAAAIDRDLMRRDKPQIYGTQYIKPNRDGLYELYKIDTTKITDAERIEYKVPTLAEQRARVKMMNKKKANELFENGMSVDEFVAFCKKTDLEESEYNLTEAALNNLGYEFMGQEKDEDALKVFILNTELNPEGYNTFDSLGECYVKMGKLKEGIAAYKKSLALNPKNDNATKVLSEIEAE